jgi:hypothetical protein
VRDSVRRHTQRKQAQQKCRAGSNPALAQIREEKKGDGML